MKSLKYDQQQQQKNNTFPSISQVKINKFTHTNKHGNVKRNRRNNKINKYLMRLMLILLMKNRQKQKNFRHHHLICIFIIHIVI